MKRIAIATIFIFAMIFVGNVYADEVYDLHAGDDFPQFKLDSDRLQIWGSVLESATSFSVLLVTDQDIPYDTIKAWYGTMLAAKLTDRIVRVFYDNTGKITSIVPR
jgi:hypothetical protein